MSCHRFESSQRIPSLTLVTLIEPSFSLMCSESPQVFILDLLGRENMETSILKIRSENSVYLTTSTEQGAVCNTRLVTLPTMRFARFV